MPNKILTLCLIHTDTHVLLGQKKRGFGEGKWNGFGGKLEKGESIEEAARREMLEESGVAVSALQKAGIIHFEFEGNPEILEVHIFRGREYVGEPFETEEMIPQWFRIDEIPFTEMWPDDEHWMPLFFAGKKFQGKFLFGEGNSILQQELNEIESF
jgi:8-oxo-dGTP diphosphatase/2-hydroxy-dATP diphosphatase